MARVQSILTYTLPATSDCPPAAPIRCGCEDLILILEDRSLLQTALRGILHVEIKSVAVSPKPVNAVDGASGASGLVWKYDYTVEYQDTDLTDPTYRLRKCDIRFNCCYGCALAYVDRQLEGYVESVTGPLVNNADPQNPVVNVSADTLVATTNGFTHTSVTGVAVNINFAHSLTNPGGAIVRLTRPDGSTNDVDICAIVAANCPPPVIPPQNPLVSIVTSGNPCFAPGPNNMIRSLGVAANVITIDSAPEHTALIIGIPDSGPVDHNDVQNVGIYAGNPTSLTINNPSACRNLAYSITLLGGAQVAVENGGRFEYGLQESPDGGGTWNFIAQGGFSTFSDNINQLFRESVPIAGLVAAGGSITRLFRFAIQVTNAFAAGSNVAVNMGVGSTQGIATTA